MLTYLCAPTSRRVQGSKVQGSGIHSLQITNPIFASVNAELFILLPMRSSCPLPLPRHLGI